jgi:hypothetical protein
VVFYERSGAVSFLVQPFGRFDEMVGTDGHAKLTVLTKLWIDLDIACWQSDTSIPSILDYDDFFYYKG